MEEVKGDEPKPTLTKSQFKREKKREKLKQKSILIDGKPASLSKLKRENYKNSKQRKQENPEYPDQNEDNEQNSFDYFNNSNDFSPKPANDPFLTYYYSIPKEKHKDEENNLDIIQPVQIEAQQVFEKKPKLSISQESIMFEHVFVEIQENLSINGSKFIFEKPLPYTRKLQIQLRSTAFEHHHSKQQNRGTQFIPIYKTDHSSQTEPVTEIADESDALPPQALTEPNINDIIEESKPSVPLPLIKEEPNDQQQVFKPVESIEIINEKKPITSTPEVKPEAKPQQSDTKPKMEENVAKQTTKKNNPKNKSQKPKPKKEVQSKFVYVPDSSKEKPKTTPKAQGKFQYVPPSAEDILNKRVMSFKLGKETVVKEKKPKHKIILSRPIQEIQLDEEDIQKLNQLKAEDRAIGSIVEPQKYVVDLQVQQFDELIVKSTRDLANIEKLLSTQQSDYVQFVSDNSTKTLEKKQMNQKIRELTHVIDDIVNQRNEVSQEIEQLSKDHVDLEKKYNVKSIASRKQEIKAITRKTEAESASNVELRKRLGQINKITRKNERLVEMEEIEIRLYECKEQNKALFVELNQKRDERAIYFKRRDELEAELSHYEAELAERKNRISKLEADKKKKENELKTEQDSRKKVIIDYYKQQDECSSKQAAKEEIELKVLSVYQEAENKMRSKEEQELTEVTKMSDEENINSLINYLTRQQKFCERQQEESIKATMSKGTTKDEIALISELRKIGKKQKKFSINLNHSRVVIQQFTRAGVQPPQYSDQIDQCIEKLNRLVNK